MKRFVAIGLAAVLAGCGAPAPKPTPEQEAASARIDSTWAQRQKVTYKGNTFGFARSHGGSVAYIMPQKRDIEYTPNDLEAIARAQTGCPGEFEAGVLAFIGGFSGDANLGIVKGKLPHWSVSLKC